MKEKKSEEKIAPIKRFRPFRRSTERASPAKKGWFWMFMFALYGVGFGIGGILLGAESVVLNNQRQYENVIAITEDPKKFNEMWNHLRYQEIKQLTDNQDSERRIKGLYNVVTVENPDEESRKNFEGWAEEMRRADYDEVTFIFAHYSYDEMRKLLLDNVDAESSLISGSPTGFLPFTSNKPIAYDGRLHRVEHLVVVTFPYYDVLWSFLFLVISLGIAYLIARIDYNFPYGLDCYDFGSMVTLMIGMPIPYFFIGGYRILEYWLDGGAHYAREISRYWQEKHAIETEQSRALAEEKAFYTNMPSELQAIRKELLKKIEELTSKMSMLPDGDDDEDVKRERAECEAMVAEYRQSVTELLQEYRTYRVLKAKRELAEFKGEVSGDLIEVKTRLKAFRSGQEVISEVMEDDAIAHKEKVH